MLARAVLAGASGQMRNMATVGGNLLQRTRCPYFQDVSKPCNKRQPGSGCPAITGDHRNLAILGHSAACRRRPCVATHPSDMAVALAALDAQVHVPGRTGSRVVPMPGLHRLPGDEPERDTVLRARRPDHRGGTAAPPPGRSTYRKVRERASFAFALVSLAAAARRRRRRDGPRLPAGPRRRGAPALAGRTRRAGPDRGARHGRGVHPGRRRGAGRGAAAAAQRLQGDAGPQPDRRHAEELLP